jgi:flagellar assembly protein FliH
MPSSPETAGRWELPEFGRGARPGAGVAQAPQFEVDATSGLPDALVARARRDAQTVGYAAGWASGIRAARAVGDAEAHAARAARERAEREHRTSVDSALHALDVAAGELEASATPGVEQLEELVVSAALEIAEALVGQVLRDDHTRSAAALRRALALAPAGEPVRVRLSPADHATITASAPAPDGTSREIELIADPTLAAGDARATCAATAIDARLSAGLARVREALGR